MSKKVENCSILVVFTARVSVATQLFKYNAKPRDPGMFCEYFYDIPRTEHLYVCDEFQTSSTSEPDG